MELAAHPATDGRGKWHIPESRAAVTPTTRCGAVVELDTQHWIAVVPGVRPHPFVCKNCLRAAK